MDRFERARQLRDDYESSLDEAEKLRARYHREVLKLHRSGLSLREIAEQLGISHQRVHQIVGVAEEPRRRGRMIGGAAGVIVVLGALIVGRAAFDDGAPSVRSIPGPSVETQAPIRTHFCAVVADPRHPSTFTPVSMADAIAHRCASVSATVASVVALDPRTGNILAMLPNEAPIVSIYGRLASLDRRLQNQLEGLFPDDERPSDQWKG